VKANLITWQGDTVIVSGRIDERFDFARFDKVPVGQTLTIDFEHLGAINSVGIRTLVDYVSKRPPGTVKFVNCTTVILEPLNAMPRAFAAVDHRDVVATFVMPFDCKQCGTVDGLVIKMDDVKVEHDEVRIPDTRCPNCRRVLQPTIDPSDLCAFLLV
jgi:hypothetical protein